MRAMQMLAFQQDLEARKEQREMNRQKFLMEIDERKRRAAIEDFQTGMALHVSGLAPVEPGTVGKFQAGMGGRSTITAPGGGQYSIPTREQQQEQAYGAARSKGVSEGITARTKEDIVNPMRDVQVETGLPGPFSTATKTVREKDRAKTIEDAYKKANPNLQFHWEDDGRGNTTMIGVDPQGQPKVQKTFQGISKPSAEKMEKPDYEAEVDATSDPNERLRRVEEWMPWAFMKTGVAGDMKNGTFYIKDTQGNDAPADSDQIAAARKLAEATVDAAMKTERERAVAQRKVGRGQAARPDPFARKTKGGGAVMPAANVASAARLKGMTETQFRQWFTQQGGVIR